MRIYAKLGVIALVLLLGLSALSVPAADRDTASTSVAEVDPAVASEPTNSRANPHIPYTAYYNQTFNIGSGWDWSELTAVVWVQTGNYKQQSNPSFRSAEVLNAHAEEFDVGVTTTNQSRTVLAELATGTWCGFCPGADGAFHRLREDAAWYPDKVVLIEWHNGDAYANADHTSRIGGTGYATGGFPTAYFDGVDASVGGASNPNTTSIDTTYRNKINARSPKATPIQIDTFGTISASGGWVNATVTADSEPTIGNLFCYIAIVETGLSYMHSGTEVPMSNTGRNIILKQGFSIPNDFPVIALGDDFAGETLNGEVEITWTATDTEDDDSTLPIDIMYSSDAGAFWNTVTTAQTNDGSYLWDTSQLEDTDKGRLKLSVKDSKNQISVDTGVGMFFLDNPNYPIVDLLTPAVGKTYSESVEVTWEAEDDEDGAAVDIDLFYADTTEIWQPLATGEDNDGSYTWDVTGLEDGQYKVKLVGTDSDSMSAEAANVGFFTIDNPQFPTAEITYPITGVWLTGENEITWTASDPDDAAGALGIDLELSGDGGTTWVTLAEGLDNDGDWKFDTLTIDDGLYTIRLTVTDTDGMQFNTVSGAFNVYNPDAPVITTTVFDDTIWTGTKDVTWTATDPDEGDQMTIDFYYSLDARMWSALSEDEENDGSLSFDTLTLPDSVYYFKLVVTDDSEDELQDSVKSPTRITIYNPDAPTVELTTPEGGETWTGGVLFEWEADDEDGDDVVVTLEYSSDGTTWYEIALDPDDYDSHRWDTTTVPDGNYYFRILGVDSSAEELTAEFELTTPVTIDNPDPPTVEISYPEGDESFETPILVTWTGDDPDRADVLTYELFYKKAGGNKWKTLTKDPEDDGSHMWSWHADGVSAGEYVIKVVVKDGTGLSGDAVSESFTLADLGGGEPIDGGDTDGEDVSGSAKGSVQDDDSNVMLIGIVAAVIAAIVIVLLLLMFMRKPKEQPLLQQPPMMAATAMPLQQGYGGQTGFGAQTGFAPAPAPAPAPDYGAMDTGFGDIYAPPPGGALAPQPGAAPPAQLPAGAPADVPLLPPPSS